MLHTKQQRKYYRGVVLPIVTKHFNDTHKKWYMITTWKDEYTHNWMKAKYFDGSTTTIEIGQWEDIMRKIRMDFSKSVHIPMPNEF